MMSWSSMHFTYIINILIYFIVLMIIENYINMCVYFILKTEGEIRYI